MSFTATPEIRANNVRQENASGCQPYSVFLSHASRDEWIAKKVAEPIRQLSDLWLDVDELAGGDAIYSQIIEAVDACDEAIVILTPHSLNSRWVLFEMGAVCGQHKRITPVLIHVEAEAIPVLQGVRAIEINQLEQTFLPELASRIKEKSLQMNRGER